MAAALCRALASSDGIDHSVLQSVYIYCITDCFCSLSVENEVEYISGCSKSMENLNRSELASCFGLVRIELSAFLTFDDDDYYYYDYDCDCDMIICTRKLSVCL